MAKQRFGLELGILLIVLDIIVSLMETYPVMTLTLIAGQVLLYSRILPTPWSLEDVCISGNTVIGNGEWRRLLIGAFEHGDDMHLYFNMASFLIKGNTLERLYGAKNFVMIILVMMLGSDIIYVLLATITSIISGNENHMETCAIGFSGVIFALKVLITAEDPTATEKVSGINMPANYVMWLELVLIELLVPNASLIGHLAGILAGILYSYTIIGRAIDRAISAVTGEPVMHGWDELREELVIIHK